jgi:hypothetical protein
MKIAVLIPGSPRFSKEFDTLIQRVSVCDQVDWYFYLWSESTSPDKNGMNLVAPKWRNIDYEWAVEKLQSNLPENHRVVALQLGDLKSIPIPQITQNITETHMERTWPMFESLYRVDLLRQQIGEEYDLVIRARNDVEVKNSIDFAQIKQLVDQDPSLIFTEVNHRYGKYNITINDFFAISSPKNIQIYCDAVNHLMEYHQKGYVFHPETMLAVHLIESGLKIAYVDFGLELRSMGSIVDNAYHADFGNWA